MNLVYEVAKIVIFIELILLALIVPSTLILKLFQVYRLKKKQKITTAIKHYLTTLNEDIQITTHFPEKWKNLELLIPIVHDLDMSHENVNWQNIRINFIKSILLPLARQNVSSLNWVSRYLAAESFVLFSEEKDKQSILKLMRDRFPVIKFCALSAGIANASEEAVNLIISQMANEPWLAQSMYFKEFDDLPPSTIGLVAKKLQVSDEPGTRIVCYNILLKYPLSNITWDIVPDLDSENIWLKAASSKFISRSDKEKSIPILIDNLEDKSWHVRAVALDCLSELNAKQAIPQIAICLRDENWLVGLAAVHALKNMGSEGVEILESLNITLDPISYQQSAHILNK